MGYIIIFQGIETHLNMVLELIGAFVVTRFRGLLAEQQRFLVEKDVTLLRFDAQSDVLL